MTRKVEDFCFCKQRLCCTRGEQLSWAFSDSSDRAGDHYGLRGASIRFDPVRTSMVDDDVLHDLITSGAKPEHHSLQQLWQWAVASRSLFSTSSSSWRVWRRMGRAATVIKNKLWRRGKPRRACGTSQPVKSSPHSLVTSVPPPQGLILKKNTQIRHLNRMSLPV